MKTIVPNTSANVEVQCVGCKNILAIKLSIEGFQKWRAGMLIQNALPELSADERELLISGYCGTCWKELFPGGEW
jgi:hypothetical protein